jgi:hypothetical protein
MDELNPKISLNQLAMLEQHQLKHPLIAGVLDISDPDYVYSCLKNLSYKQYKFLNYLFSEGHYRKVANILYHTGLKRSSEYKSIKK